MHSDAEIRFTVYVQLHCHLNWIFNSARERVCFEVTNVRKTFDWTEALSWFGTFPLFFLSHWDFHLWILPFDSRAISKHRFWHQEVACLIWMKWLKLSRNEWRGIIKIHATQPRKTCSHCTYTPLRCGSLPHLPAPASLPTLDHLSSH